MLTIQKYNNHSSVHVYRYLKYPCDLDQLLGHLITYRLSSHHCQYVIHHVLPFFLLITLAIYVPLKQQSQVELSRTLTPLHEYVA